jgi:fructose-1,6-bisphosphatase
MKLTGKELREINENHNEMSNLELQIQNDDLKNKIIYLEVKNLELRHQVKAQEQNFLSAIIKEKRITLQKKKEEYFKVKEDLKIKYKLKENWGFDPITGEIDDGEEIQVCR